VSNLSNLSQRLLTAAVLVAAFLLALFQAPALAWSAFILLFLTAGAWEWAGLARWSMPWRLAYAAITGVLAVLVEAYGLASHELAYLPALLFWLLAAPLWLHRGWPAPRGAVAAAVGWLLLLPTYLALQLLREVGPWVLLAAVSLAIVADSAAYFAGRTLGRHKLAPAISPGKTWEGAAGGALGVLAFWLALPLPAGLNHPAFLFALCLLFVLSVLGDLFESWIKRQAGVKDSSQLLPGHGGILDRIDSQLAVLPAAALFWILLT